MEAVDRDTSLAIGEALYLLRVEFPDISISKIRFLEAKGLIAPERTTSGFRRFLPEDIDRLRAILRMQRDQYLPLKIIREQFGVNLKDDHEQRRSRGARKVRTDQQRLEFDKVPTIDPLDLDNPDAILRLSAIESSKPSAVDHAVPLDAQNNLDTALLGNANSREFQIQKFNNQLRDVVSESIQVETRSFHLVTNMENDDLPHVDGVSDKTKEILESKSHIATPIKSVSPVNLPRPTGRIEEKTEITRVENRNRVRPTSLPGKVLVQPRNVEQAPPISGSSKDTQTRDNGLRRNSVHQPTNEIISRQKNVISSSRQQEISKPNVEVEIPPGCLTMREFQRETSTTAAFLADLDLFGIVKPIYVGNTLVYSCEHLELVKVAKSLAGLGFTPRHLKSLRVSIEKEFGLIEQLVVTQLGVGGTRARRRAEEIANLLNSQTAHFRGQMLGSLIKGILPEPKK